MNYRIFYKFDYNRAVELLYDAKEKANEIYLDELDCSKSWARTTTDKTFDEIIEMYKDSNSFRHVVFIEDNKSVVFPKMKDRLEVGLRTSGNGKDYFIFIYLDKKYLDYFVEKYDMERM